MNRDLQKYIDEYKRRYFRKDNIYGEGAFYASDYCKIRDISGGRHADIYSVMDNSFMAAFMIGYKKAQRDMRKKGRASNG